MERVFECLCSASCDIMDGWHLISSKNIAKLLEIPQKDVLKELRRLKKEGLVYSSWENFYSEYYERWFITSGWAITEKAKQTEQYKRAWEREREVCQECFNIDIGSYEQMKKREREFEKWQI